MRRAADKPMQTAPQRTLLAFDFGLKRIGVAVGTRITATSHPVTTLTTGPAGIDWPRISHLIQTWEPDGLVLGLPLHEDGSGHKLTERVRRFGRQLEGRYRLPVHFVDEYLSSWEARSDLADARHAGRRRRIRRGEIDARAAQRILQGFLEEPPHDPA